jgi:hypothetical protein
MRATGALPASICFLPFGHEIAAFGNHADMQRNHFQSARDGVNRPRAIVDGIRQPFATLQHNNGHYLKGLLGGRAAR